MLPSFAIRPDRAGTHYRRDDHISGGILQTGSFTDLVTVKS
jgi:hypothetical protein